jgi:hypothetical protein
MYLVDTNIWLELLLDQEKAQDVRRFFQVTGGDRINISEFSLYSMGVILTQLVLLALCSMLPAPCAYDGLTIVSFDSDFDRTKLGRKTPAEL